MAIGNPITLTSNVASKTINVIATASQSLFTVTGGYRINEIAVFRNGVRLVDGRDFTARDGSTVTLLSAASEGDALEFQIFDTFRVADAITPFDSDQTIAGNLNITGILSASQLGSVNFNVTSGIQTFNDVRVGGALTVAGVLTYDDVTNVDSIGVITARSGINIVGGGLTATGVSTFFSEVRVGTANSNNAFLNINPPSGHGDQYVMRLRNDGDNSTKLLFANKSAGLGQIWYQEAFRFVDDANSDAERLRIDSSGRVLIGTTSDITGSSDTSIQVVHTGGGRVILGRNDSSVTDGNDLGVIGFYSNDDSSYQEAARIYAEADGTFANDDKPGRLVFATTPDNSSQVAERLRITSEGHIKHTGLRDGNSENKLAYYTVPSHDTSEEDVLVFSVANESSSNQITFGGGPSALNAATEIVFRTASAVDTTVGSERLRIDSSGRLLINHTTARTDFFQATGLNALINVEGANNATRATSFVYNSNDAGQHLLVLGKSRGTSVGSNTVVQNNDNLGGISFHGADGSKLVEGARIEGEVDGATGTDDMPGRLVFLTTSDGAAATTERLRIDSSGRVLIGTTSLIDSSTASNFQIAHSSGPRLCIARNNTTVTGGNLMGAIDFYGNDSNGTYEICGRMILEADGTHTNDSKPTRMAFYTTPDGSDTATERLRITNAGHVSVVGDNQKLLIGSGDDIEIYHDGSASYIHDNGTGDLNICMESGSKLVVQSGTGGNHIAEFNHEGAAELFHNGSQKLATSSTGVDITGNIVVGTDINSSLNGIKMYVSGSDPSVIAAKADNNPGAAVTLLKLAGYSQSGSNYRENAAILFETDSSNNSGNASGRILLRTENHNSTNGPSTRMQIDDEGSLFNYSENHGIYTESSVGAGNSKYLYRGANSSGSNIVFNVWSDGDVESATNSFGPVSDLKLKENIVNAGSQWADIKSVKFRKFNFKEETGYQTHTQLGVIAQELEAISPGLVYETPDIDRDGNDLGTTTKKVKASVLTMKALVALQEAMNRIETLEAQVAALQG